MLSRAPQRRRGFALVLSLAVMALMVLVVLSLAALLRVESMAAVARQVSLVARLNAVAAARLAQSAVQQSLGPDTRSDFGGTQLLGPGPDGRPLLALGEFTRADGDYAHPRAAEGNSNFGLPGWPRQADVLRPLAPIITVRDDTVVVRAHGSASSAGGSASAWCEVVLVRTPEYVDARVPAHESPVGDAVSSGTSGLPNIALGRRYRVAAFRWLAPHEL